MIKEINKAIYLIVSIMKDGDVGKIIKYIYKGYNRSHHIILGTNPEEIKKGGSFLSTKNKNKDKVGRPETEGQEAKCARFETIKQMMCCASIRTRRAGLRQQTDQDKGRKLERKAILDRGFVSESSSMF